MLTSPLVDFIFYQIYGPRVYIQRPHRKKYEGPMSAIENSTRIISIEIRGRLSWAVMG